MNCNSYESVLLWFSLQNRVPIIKCFISVQVLNAQKAGYKAAIVHNVDSDDLISMGSNDCKIITLLPLIC